MQDNEFHDLYIPADMIFHTTDPTKHRPVGEADCPSADLENPRLLRELNFIFVFTKDRHCAFS